MKIAVIGGGAAGFFAALAAKEAAPNSEVFLLERSARPLAKVRISGGGRCNVTHGCFDPKLLVKHYPRGFKELLGPFHHFQPRDTVNWFESRGVPLKEERDGRIFPISDSSESIINCLMQEIERLKVILRTQAKVERIAFYQDYFVIEQSGQPTLEVDRLILATGSSKEGFAFAQELGHTIEPLVPSLFTFNIPTPELAPLAGVTLSHVSLSLQGSSLKESGPLLITHWGFSGPAALKLSAFGARFLAEKNYHATVRVDWLTDLSKEELLHHFEELKELQPTKQLGNLPLFTLPKSLIRFLLTQAELAPERMVRTLQKGEIKKLMEKLKEDDYQIQGKTTNKEEFVTCGGVRLSEINFKTMESRICPGLFFSGEILDIDGITGGFNFQNAWTTGWLAGRGAVDF